jgi:hypothetical protein
MMAAVYVDEWMARSMHRGKENEESEEMMEIKVEKEKEGRCVGEVGWFMPRISPQPPRRRRGLRWAFNGNAQ